MRTGSGFLVPKAIMCKKDGLAVLRRPVTVGLLQDVFFSSREVSEHVGNFVAALYRQVREMRVWQNDGVGEGGGAAGL